MKREILRREKDSSKVFIVENVVDLDVFRPLNVERPEFLRGKFVVMYSGNLGPMYDFDTVLEVAKDLSRFEDIVFVLRGSGERLDMIKSGIKEFGLDNVFVFDKVLDVKEVAEFLNMADVLFLPMKKLDNAEVSFPIKLIEYLACGKPVVCCAEGETAKLACESKAGFVVSPSDSKALSEMILKLYCNKDGEGDLGRMGRAFSEEFFSHQGMAAKLENFFVELEQ
jgi:glycosyltransferase involved in cell wall biosynthesis